MTDQQDSQDFNERVGANVQRFRKASGVSQAELARQLAERGFSFQQPTILKVEKGTRPLKVDELAVIAEVLRINPASLLEQPDERLVPLDKLHAAEAAILRCDRERERCKQELERLEAEIEHHKRLRHEAAEQLVAIFEAQGRLDLASFYTNLEPTENLITTWRQANG